MDKVKVFPIACSFAVTEGKMRKPVVAEEACSGRSAYPGSGSRSNRLPTRITLTFYSNDIMYLSTYSNNMFHFLPA